MFDAARENNVELDRHLADSTDFFIQFAQYCIIVSFVFLILTDFALRSSTYLREYIDGTLGMRKVKGQFKL